MLTRLPIANAAALLLIASRLGAAVDYVREVKPILAEHCYRCHGASQQKSGLRVDTAALAAKGGENGPAFKPGQAQGLMVQVIKGTHPDIARMPYKKPPLSDSQIALIEKWIAEGAVAPTNEAPESARHWAFLPPVRAALPKVRNASWPRNAIDFFVLERLERESVRPSPEADRVTLIRRLSLDLVGLPPTIAEVDGFVNDQRADAYERLVERLLASPHYGERWGRHWLDVARYADSNGYSIDAPRSIWKYRDWVIAAMNRDLPFDEFTIEQLAGDLLPNATVGQKIATGFHRNTQINQEGGIDPEQFRVESVIDRVNTTSSGFLGLTIGCAQCHDHKFDPITQREYYQLFAFFNQSVDDGHGKGTPGGTLEVPGEVESHEDAQKERQEAEQDLERYLDTKGSAVSKWEQALAPEARAKLKSAVVTALKTPAEKRTVRQKRIVYAAVRPDDSEFKSRTSKLTSLEKGPRPVTTLVLAEAKEHRHNFLFIKGDFTRDGGDVAPGVPAILSAPNTAEGSLSPPRGEGKGEGSVPTRLDLARWIADPNNPLTARVIVNRLWQEYFGRGIVETENDFGTQGIPPTHPQLLDWLATELIAQKWSLKAIHRLIVNSTTYRESSRARPDLNTLDPNNKLLARQSRLRLDAEIVRDAALSASGLLTPKLVGPPVFPPQPDGVMTLGQVKRAWTPSTGADRYRRGLYTHFWRATPHPALAVFDAPDAFSACTRRLRSNTPLQALTLLNDAAFYEFAEALAKRAVAQAPASDDARLNFAFRLCLSRQPNDREMQRLRDLLTEQLAAESGNQLAAWTTVARVLLNLDETITRE